MTDHQERLQIGEFASLVGLTIPQLRRYDRMKLLEPAERSAGSGYRYYNRGQTGAARVIALLRSMDMPISEIRRILAGADEGQRQQLFVNHRSRLEARLDEARRLLEAVDAITKEKAVGLNPDTRMSSWLHLMPRLPVCDMERSITYYQEALGFALAWRTGDNQLAALSSGDIEMLLLVPWAGDGLPPPQTSYVYTEDPDGLCDEYRLAGADVVDPVASRPNGMRDFVVRDPDGHLFTIGRGEERIRDVADQYGLTPDQVAVNPNWLQRRH